VGCHKTRSSRCWRRCRWGEIFIMRLALDAATIRCGNSRDSRILCFRLAAATIEVLSRWRVACFGCHMTSTWATCAATWSHQTRWSRCWRRCRWGGGAACCNVMTSTLHSLQFPSVIATALQTPCSGCQVIHFPSFACSLLVVCLFAGGPP
jgi:hypothetical protein